MPRKKERISRVKTGYGGWRTETEQISSPAVENKHAHQGRSTGARFARLAYDAAMGATEMALRSAGPFATRWRERTGRYEAVPRDGCIWLHACSAGEMMVARRFADCWRRHKGQSNILITAWTRDGHGIATHQQREGEHVAWFPVDSRGAMRRAYDSIRPKAVILCETELWPNHLTEAKARRIPVFVINGRMSAQDHAKYKLIKALATEFFGIPDVVFAQSEQDSRRFSLLGASEAVVTGNMKFDAMTPNDRRTCELSEFAGIPYLLAASTHPGEEAAVIQAFAKLRQVRPDLRLVVAPRHVHRSGNIARAAVRSGLRTEIWRQGERIADAECIVFDRLGVLPALYASAEFAFVGKSLVAGGGQNFLESVEAGCPVIVGPRTENFDTMLAPFLGRGAVVQLGDSKQLPQAFADLATNRGMRTAMASEARRVMKEHSGATERTVREILSRL